MKTKKEHPHDKMMTYVDLLKAFVRENPDLAGKHPAFLISQDGTKAELVCDNNLNKKNNKSEPMHQITLDNPNEETKLTSSFSFK